MPTSRRSGRRSTGSRASSLDELASEPAVIAAVQEGVDEANKRLARVEEIKKFTIVEATGLRAATS